MKVGDTNDSKPGDSNQETEPTAESSITAESSTTDTTVVRDVDSTCEGGSIKMASSDNVDEAAQLSDVRVDGSECVLTGLDAFCFVSFIWMLNLIPRTLVLKYYVS